MNDIERIEKQIRGKMVAIKKGDQEAKKEIGKLFKYLKERDLALYENLLREYKKLSIELGNNSKNKDLEK